MDTKTFLPIYNAYKQGDATIRSFCHSHNIPIHTFCYWRTKLLSEISRKTSTAKSSANNFIEIIPSSPKRRLKNHPSPLPSGSNNSSPLQIQIGPATFLLTDGFSKAAFIQSVQALQDANLCWCYQAPFVSSSAKNPPICALDMKGSPSSLKIFSTKAQPLDIYLSSSINRKTAAKCSSGIMVAFGYSVKDWNRELSPYPSIPK